MFETIAWEGGMMKSEGFRFRFLGVCTTVVSLTLKFDGIGSFFGARTLSAMRNTLSLSAL